MSDLVPVLDEFTMPTYRRWPIELVSGSGGRVVDSEGRSYIDLVAGVAVASVGHAHPAVAAAIAGQAARLIHVSNLYHTRPQALLAERLSMITGGMRCFFGNSGAEAVECALKLARKWSRSTRSDDAVEIVAAEGGFHGRTFGALAATGQPAKRAPFEPLPPGFRHVPYGDAAALEAAVNDRTAAVLLEPIQGEAGVIVPPPEYLAEAREITRRAGALLILDEIQTGLGRTGSWLAAQYFGVDADVILLGKAIAGGLPMGVCLARPEIAEAFTFGDHGSTFGGGPVQASAALAVLDVIESEGLLARARVAGARMMDGLRMVAPHAAVRGAGLLIGMELDEPVARRVTETALDRGVLVNNATDHVVRLCPPLVITDEDIDISLGVLGEVMAREAAAS